MAEEVKETKRKTAQRTKKEILPENNRFTEVIEKMEEETKKVEKKEKTVEQKKEKKDKKEVKNKIESSINKNTKLIKMTQQEKELEIIENEIKNNNMTYKEEIAKSYKDIFINIMYANAIVIYFILLIIARKLAIPTIFFNIIRACSIILILLTVGIFEIAYKKDSGKYAVKGIEFMFLSISTLITLKVFLHYNNKLISFMTSIALLFAIYYVGKSIVIYIKQKKEAKKYKNDIRKIANKKQREENI